MGTIAKRKNTYQLLEDAYNGAGGFEDGSYLRQHPREQLDKYIQRKESAYYLNYTKPCLDAHVDPIFERNPNREWEGAAANLWGTFIADTDFVGTPLNDLMKRAAQMAKLCGVSFIVVDKDNIGEAKETTLAELEQRGNLPYAIVIAPREVEEIKVDRFGRIIRFAYTEVDPGDNNKTNTRVLMCGGWELKSGTSNQGINLASGSWALGCVPVVPIFSRETKPGEYFPTSEFLSIAKTNRHIYNACSWLAEILSGQTFPLLIIPTTTGEDVEIGAGNGMAFSPESKHAPGYIAPPNGPAEALANNIEASRQECYRMAGVVNVTGVATASSGVAKAWDFKHTNQMLANFSGVLQAAELRIAQLFSKWVGVDLNLTVSYPTDFAYSDLEAELNNAVIAKDLTFGDEFNIEVFKRVLTNYFPELPPDKFDALVESYKKAQAEQDRDKQELKKNFVDPDGLEPNPGDE